MEKERDNWQRTAGKGLTADHLEPMLTDELASQMAELGYEVGASNAAFLLDRGKVRLDGKAFKGKE